MAQNLILNIYGAFADQLKIRLKNPLTDKNLHDLIASLNKIDNKIHALIASYESALQSVSFFEKEKEMRIKFPEIWKVQLQEAKNSVRSIRIQIIELGTKHKADIAQIFKVYEKQNLSLDDFSKIG